MRWTGHDEFSPPSLSPLHAKVLNYLGGDSTTELHETAEVSIGMSKPGLFLETWSEWKPATDSEASPDDPMELKTIQLPSVQGHGDEANGAVSGGQTEGSQERERESDVLLSGRSEGEGLREAGQTLRNPFAETFPEQEDGQSLPFELRTIRRAPVGEAAGRQSFEDDFHRSSYMQTLRSCLVSGGGFDSEPLDDAMELRTLRRDDVAGPPPDPPLPVAEIAAADGLEAEPEGLALRQSGQPPSLGEGQFEASASPRGDVATATTRMDGEELEAECEVLEAAAQSLKLSQQSSHLTELVSEGPGGPSFSEKPEAGLAWEAAEPISALHVPGQGSAGIAGVQEVKAGMLQDSVSSPAHSAVTTPATSGYQTLPKGVDPVEVACDPVPGAVFTAEDEAVMGLKRRGGVEVVVEPPRAKATNAIQREPLSARSARSREGDSGDHGDPDPGPPGPGPPSEPRKPSSGLSGDRSGEPSPAGSLGLQGAPAPMVARPHAQGRPPRQPATPAGSASTESEQPSLPRRRTPSLGRRPSLPKAGSARRSSSAGRSGNRKLVRNALEKYCLKGDANREQRELVLKSFDEDLERFDRFIILFRSIHTGRHDLRALYGFSEGSWSRVLQILPSPASLEERMVVQCLRYDSGGKEFKEVPASQEPLSVADAVFLHPQFLQRSRVVVP